MKRKYNISIVGQSNTGKSTLINYLCKKYVTTENKKLQTTRVNLHNSSIINNIPINIIDTPGVSLSNNDLLSTSMKNSYIKTLESIDLLILMMDIKSKDLHYEDSILKISESLNVVTIILVNKIDLAPNDLSHLELIKSNLSNKYQNMVFFISILTEEGMPQLIEYLTLTLLEKKPIDIASKLSPKNMRISMQEIIQGIIIEKTHGEIPYDTAVHIFSNDIGKKIIKISATIYVSKENQKKIVIGKNGEMVKNIGISSRKLLENIYNKKIFLKLNIIKKENWKNNYTLLREIGYID